MQEKNYDLEDRSYEFAKAVRELVYVLPKAIPNYEDGKQVTRSSGSVGANYIEANEALGKKDFLMRIKICRKEAKETKFWLSLLDNPHNGTCVEKIRVLKQEATELMMIFGSILRKSM